MSQIDGIGTAADAAVEVDLLTRAGDVAGTVLSQTPSWVWGVLVALGSALLVSAVKRVFRRPVRSDLGRNYEKDLRSPDYDRVKVTFVRRWLGYFRRPLVSVECTDTGLSVANYRGKFRGRPGLDRDGFVQCRGHGRDHLLTPDDIRILKGLIPKLVADETRHRLDNQATVALADHQGVMRQRTPSPEPADPSAPLPKAASESWNRVHSG
jgi:hypothetical protein